MPAIGPGMELDFPPEAVLLADKAFPCDWPLITPYRGPLNGVEDEELKRLWNRQINRYRVRVEHANNWVKDLHIIKYIYRQSREWHPTIVEICVSIAFRRLELVHSLAGD